MLRYVLFIALLSSLKLHSQLPGTVMITGRTVGNLPYINYGLGEDRLGGAKMGYLDTNVVVQVVDSVIGNYKIRLSQNHMAWLPKNYFKRDSIPSRKNYYLSSSWKVYGDSLYDYLMLSLDDQLPYAARQETNPARLVIDVFGLTNNTNWITQLSSAKEIKNVSQQQPEDDLFRITIDLAHAQHWGYKIYYENKKLVVRIKRPPSNMRLDHMVIAVDAGHGGTNGGASGVKTNIAEKDYTLRIAKELQKALLAENATVFMTREKDTTLGMNERWQMAAAQNPDFLVSIHLNSSSKDSIQGVSTYYRYPGFRPLSQFILRRMLETGLAEFGNVGSFNFTLNAPTEFPNCLVEVAFLSNEEDEKRIRDPAFQKLVAEKIVEGIKDWLRSSE